MKGSPLIVGVFNVHVEVPISPLVVRLSALLDDFGLDQAVTLPTHQRGHTLDLGLTRRDDSLLQITDADHTLDQSDHHCVVSDLPLSCLSCPPVYAEARKFFAVDLATFKTDVQAKLLASPQLSADQLYHPNP